MTAVTVCIFYSGYLLRTIANRSHFERWIIVTIEQDTSTIELCARYGLECVTVDMRPFQLGFHAAFNKSRYLNAGLERISGEEWVCILDADALLPPSFRTIFDDLIQCSYVVPGFLYGAYGRRIAKDFAEFDGLKSCPVWDGRLQTHKSIVGYLNLFHTSAKPNKYPVSDGNNHDDWNFYAAFGERTRVLPLSVLHVGRTRINWAGISGNRSTADLGVSPSASLDFNRSCEQILVCGTLEPLPLLARIAAERIVFIDAWSLTCERETGNLYRQMNDNWRGFMKLFSRSVFVSSRQSICRHHQTLLASGQGNRAFIATLTSLADQSSDHVFFHGSYMDDWLLRNSGRLRAKSKPSCVFTGQGGPPQRGSAWSQVVHSVFSGVSAAGNGDWTAQRLSYPAAAVLQEENSLQYDPGYFSSRRSADRSLSPVCVVVIGQERILAAILTLLSLRDSYKGVVDLVYAGPAVFTVPLVCNRLDVRLRRYSRQEAEALLCGSATETDEGLTAKILRKLPAGSKVMLAGDIVVRSAGGFGTASPEQRAALIPRYEYLALREFSVFVDASGRDTVCTVVYEGDEDEFVKQCLAMTLPDGMRRIAFSSNPVNLRHLLECNAIEVECLSLPPVMDRSDPEWIYAINCARKLCAGRIIYLDSMVKPTAGAELFAWATQHEAVFSSWRFARLSKSEAANAMHLSGDGASSNGWLAGRVVRLPKVGPPACLLSVEILDLTQEWHQRIPHPQSWEHSLQQCVHHYGLAVTYDDFYARGWNS